LTCINAVFDELRCRYAANARSGAIVDLIADVHVLPTTPTIRGFDPDGVCARLEDRLMIAKRRRVF